MDITPSTQATFRVAEGEVWIYRLFDVAYAIDLTAAGRRGPSPAVHLALEGPQSASALEFPRAPLHVSLGQREVPLRSGPRAATASAHVFDYGVVSVRYRVPIPAGTSLEALIPLAEELLEGPTTALDDLARQHAQEVAASLGEALEKPFTWQGLESYHVFFVKRFEGGGTTAARLLAEAPIPPLLLGETSPVRLSDAERQDVLSNQFSYLENDLTVIHWNSALVVEPSGVEDVPDLLEFATAHLLELRYYDDLLDRELHRIYDQLETGRDTFMNVLTRKYRRLQRYTAALLLDLSETIERLENAVKIVGDFYLARVYQAAVKRFRLAAWQETLLRKQKLVAEVNDLTGDSADTSRGELLEIVVILLITWEVVAAFVAH